MATKLNVYDRVTRKKTAVLQNAYNIVETQEINQIYSLSFTLPAEDEKNKYCLPRHYVRYGETGELYRIKSPKVSENNTSWITYECEHVITTLCDDIMFGSYTYGGKGVYTTATINWLLNKQKTKNWKLGTCAFSHQYEYNWEQENLLNSLYSIPKEFASNYMWTFNTVNYPWTLNLIEIDKTATPEYYLRAKSNILASGSSADYANICTRIYPLGYGEGVNQLTIKDATVTNVAKSGNVNVNGVPSEATNAVKYGNTFIQSPQTYIDKYGIVEKVLVDRRFEQANTLFGYAKQMLEVYQEPTMSRSFDVTDLYPITNKPLDDAQVGKICKMTQDDTVAYITRTQRRLDVAGDLQIDLSTKASDLASNVADLADRIRIESVYSQGATQLYQHSKDANATPEKGMIMSLYFPSEMKQINKVLLRLKLGKFRSYSQATDSKTVTVQSCENVTVTLKTNPAALTGNYTSSDGGGTTSINGGEVVTVSGGSKSGNTTGGTGVSVSVSATGTVSAPMATRTSAPSTDTTSGASWAGSNGYTSTEYTPNGAVNVQITTDGKLYGETYGASGSGSDGLHSHDQDDIDNETNSGGHSHYVNVNAPTTVSSAVKINSSAYIPLNDQTKHLHFINYNAFAHDHNINHYHTVTVSGSGSSSSQHTHTFTIPNHSHTITAHSHKLPNLTHSHAITLNGHTHSIVLNGHSHAITPGIFESGNPTAFDIYVKGENKGTVNAKSYNGDITQWLLDSTTKMVPRNTWIDVEIRPNSLAYVQASVFVQGFVQSRGGGNY